MTTSTAPDAAARPTAGASDPTRNATVRESRQVAEAARETEWTKPSFAKELFLGRFSLDLIHPHPQPAPADVARGEAFLARLEHFLRTEVDGEEIEREAKIPESVLKGLADLGALGMKIEPAYGGIGLTQLYYNRALELAGTVHGSIATLLSAHQSIGVPEPLRKFGTEEQKAHYLPRVARDEISAFLLTEPDVGSDPARLSTSAVPTEDGSAYVLNGTKLWTTNGVIAKLLVVMAVVPKSEGHRGGITAFVVEADSPGIEVLHRNSFLGLRGIENGVTQFTDVRVPAANVIGREGIGLKIALTTLNTGRLALPAMCAAGSKWSLRIARQWSNERVQWGMPVGRHEAVAQKIAYIAGISFALEAVVEMSSMMADEDRKDIRIEAALAKLFASEHGWKVVDDLVQIRGGRGFETAASLRARGERAVPAEQVLRDMRINRIFEGSSEIMRLLIAREAVDQHLKVAGDIIDPDAPLAAKGRAVLRATAFYARWFPTLVTGAGQRRSSYAEFGSLARHLRYVERSSRKLARSTFYGMSRWQGRLERKQAFLGRIVDIGAELFTMSAAIVKAQLMVDQHDVDATAGVELADLFCRAARRRADALFHDLWSNDDAYNYGRAMQVLDGDYVFAEAGVIDTSGDGRFIPLAQRADHPGSTTALPKAAS